MQIVPPQILSRFTISSTILGLLHYSAVNVVSKTVMAVGQIYTKSTQYTTVHLHISHHHFGRKI